MLGANLAFLNRLREGMEHLESGIAAYEPESHGSGRFQLGNNPAVVCFTTSALVLWMLGYPDRARDRASAAVGLSVRLNHPSSMAYAQFHTGLLHLWGRDDTSAHGCAQAVLDIAEEHDFPIWRAVGCCLRGAAMAGMGSADEGLAVIERAMSTYQRLKTPPVFWPILLYLQAGACGLAGRPADGLTLIDEAVEIAMQTPGRTLWSEFFGLKGDLLLALSPDTLSPATRPKPSPGSSGPRTPRPRCRPPCCSCEPRCRLGRLWREQGKTEQARELLSGAYDRFTEGFTTPDLLEAGALLEEL